METYMNEPNIEKSKQSNYDDILTAITSFNDPSIIVNMFKTLGWSYSLEIQETLALARQNANLSIKFKAIKYLRDLLREAAETSGLVANVSHTIPNSGGGHTTMSGKRIAGMLSPVKKIESTIIKESQNDQKRLQPIAGSSGCDEKSRIEETESDRGCDRQESNNSENTTNRCDFSETFPQEDQGANPSGSSCPPDSTRFGSPEPTDGGIPPEQRRPNLPTESPDNQIGIGPERKNAGKCGGNPCIKTRPPTCDRDLFPGISTSAGD